MREVMVDIETLASEQNAVVASIGAVEFDVVTGELGKRYYHVLHMLDQHGRGRICHPSTVLWWMNQSEAARRSLLQQPGPLTNEEKLKELVSFIDDAPVWANGPDFDCVILHSLMKDYGVHPFPYYSHRCYRTIKMLTRHKVQRLQREGTHHDALDDAEYQARALIEMRKAIGI